MCWLFDWRICLRSHWDFIVWMNPIKRSDWRDPPKSTINWPHLWCGGYQDDKDHNSGWYQLWYGLFSYYQAWEEDVGGVVKSSNRPTMDNMIRRDSIDLINPAMLILDRSQTLQCMCWTKKHILVVILVSHHTEDHFTLDTWIQISMGEEHVNLSGSSYLNLSQQT